MTMDRLSNANILLILDHDPELGEGNYPLRRQRFLGPYILENDPKIVSVGRSPCSTTNRHIHVNSLADSRLEFDKVIYLIGHSDHYQLERDVIPLGEPTTFDYHTIPRIQVTEQLKTRKLTKFMHFSSVLIYDEDKISLPVSEHSRAQPLQE